MRTFAFGTNACCVSLIVPWRALLNWAAAGSAVSSRNRRNRNPGLRDLAMNIGPPSARPVLEPVCVASRRDYSAASDGGRRLFVWKGRNETRREGRRTGRRHRTCASAAPLLRFEDPVALLPATS